MKCTTPSIEQLTNAVNNHKAFYDINRNQDQLTTDAYLSHTQANFKKVDSQYQTKTGEKLATTITTEISKEFERRNPGFRDNQERMKIVEFKAKVGTVIHETNEAIGKFMISQIRDKSPEDALAALDAMTFDSLNITWPDAKGLVINNASKENIFKGMKDVLIQIQNRQKYINRRLGTTGSVKIYMEQIIIDPVNDIGGTADLIALYSDNTASVFDFKTKMPRKEFLDASGNLVSDKFISTSDRERYKVQLGSIQKILLQRYGVRQVVQSRIVPIQINVPFDSAAKAYSNTVTKIAYGDKQNPFLAQLAPLPELTGFKDLDEFLTSIEKKIKNYESKLKTDKSNAEYYKNKIRDLNESKVNVLVKHSFNDLVSYATRLLDSLSKDALDQMSIEKLRDAKDELKTLTMLSSATYEYREALKAGKNTELVAKIEETIKEITARVNDKLYEVEEELYAKRVSDAVSKLTGYNITDASGNFIPLNDEGFFGKYFNQLSQFENPIFKAFRTKLDESQFNIRAKVKELIAEVTKVDGDLRKWMRENGKDEEWLISSLIDRDPKSKDVDNLFNKISKEFRDNVKQAKEKGDTKFFIDNFEPSDGYSKWFNQAKVEQEKYFISKFGDKTGQLKFREWLSQHDLSLSTKGVPNYPTAWLEQGRRNKLKRKKSVEEANYSKEYKYIKSIPQLNAYYNLFEKYNNEFRKILGVEYYNLPNNFLPNIRKSNIDRLLDNGIFNGTADVFNNFMQELNVREDDMMYGEIDPETGSLKRTIPRFFINSFKDKDGNVIVGEKSYDLTKSLIIFSKMAYNYQEMNQIEGTVLAMRDFLIEKGDMVIRRGSNPLKDFVGNDLTTKIKGKDIERIFQSFVDLYLYGVTINPISDDSSGKYEKLILGAKQYFTLKALGLGFIPAAGSFLAAKTQAAIEGFKGQIYTKDQYKEAVTDSWKNRDKFLALYAYFDPMDVEYDFFNVTGERTTLGDPRERNKVKRYVNSRTLLRPFSLGDEYLDEVIITAMAKNFYIDENGDLRRMRNDDERKQFESRSIWNLFNYDGENAGLSLQQVNKQLPQASIDYLKSLQESDGKITVYRGVLPGGEKGTGQFWTSNKSVAEKYMERFGTKGTLLTKRITMQEAINSFMGLEGNNNFAKGSDIFSITNKGNLSEEQIKNIQIKFKRAVQSAQSKIKGVIPEEDKAYWQTQLLGQVVMHFKSWMPGILRERFGKAKYNDALQLVEMGRLTAFGQEIYNHEQLGIPEFMKSIVLPKLLQLAKNVAWFTGHGSDVRIRLAYENWLDKNPQYRGKVTYEEFLEAQRTQMKALILELRIILAFATLIALLGADYDDDGKKFYQEMWITRKLVAIMAKTNQEISFTYNPSEFAKMIKNPIPMAGVLVDATNIIGNTYDETLDITLGEKFPMPFHKPQDQDKTGIGFYTTKVVPGASQLEKFLEIFGEEQPIK